MEIKVNQIAQPQNVESVKPTETPDVPFKFVLSSNVEEAELQQRLMGMMEEITMQGDRLKKKMDIRDMKRYRGLIKDFLIFDLVFHPDDTAQSLFDFLFTASGVLIGSRGVANDEDGRCLVGHGRR